MFLLLAILADVKVVDDVEEVLHHRHLLEANPIVALRILQRENEATLSTGENGVVSGEAMVKLYEAP